MTDKTKTTGQQAGNVATDPADWKTGDEPMTGARRSYLRPLAEAGEEVDYNLTKAEAGQRIEALERKTGRGRG